MLNRRRIAVAVVLALGPIVYAGCSESARSYVNPAACAGCHAGIYQSYQRTGMGRSFARADAANAPEDYRAKNHLYHRASDRSYTMIERGGKPIQQRHQLGYEGKVTNEVETQVDYVIGSGNHARSYLH